MNKKILTFAFVIDWLVFLLYTALSPYNLLHILIFLISLISVVIGTIAFISRLVKKGGNKTALFIVSGIGEIISGAFCLFKGSLGLFTFLLSLLGIFLYWIIIVHHLDQQSNNRFIQYNLSALYWLTKHLNVFVIGAAIISGILAVISFFCMPFLFESIIWFVSLCGLMVAIMGFWMNGKAHIKKGYLLNTLSFFLCLVFFVFGILFVENPAFNPWYMKTENLNNITYKIPKQWNKSVHDLSDDLFNEDYGVNYTLDKSNTNYSDHYSFSISFLKTKNLYHAKDLIESYNTSNFAYGYKKQDPFTIDGKLAYQCEFYEQMNSVTSYGNTTNANRAIAFDMDGSSVLIWISYPDGAENSTFVKIVPTIIQSIKIE